MNKYYGFVGFARNVETKPDVYEQVVEERAYYGDVFKINRKLVTSDHLNDNIIASTRISIVADPFAYNHFHEIVYLSWMGANWKVTDVQVEYPRLIMEIGGLYNGQTGPKREAP